MSHEALSPEQFKMFQANPKEMGGVPHHTVEAWAPEHADTDWAKAPPAERYQYSGTDVDPGHRPIGSISWHHKTGEILGVYTSQERQRQGVATALLGHARQTAAESRGVVSPKHSADRTTSGDAWARAVGGRVPARRQKP